MSIDIRGAVLAEVEIKIAAGEDLHRAAEAEERAQAALADAQAAVAEARRGALKAGWTEAELKRLGLVPGTRAARARKPRTAASTEHSEVE